MDGFKKLSTFLVKVLLQHRGIIFVDSVLILLISLDHVVLVDLFILFAVNLTYFVYLALKFDKQ